MRRSLKDAKMSRGACKEDSEATVLHHMGRMQHAERRMIRPESQQLVRIRTELRALDQRARSISPVPVSTRNRIRGVLNQIKAAAAIEDDDDTLSLRLGAAEAQIPSLKDDLREKEKDALERLRNAAMEEQRSREERNQRLLQERLAAEAKERQKDEEQKEWEQVLALQREIEEEERRRKKLDIEKKRQETKQAFLKQKKVRCDSMLLHARLEDRV
jgi:hypothetical protein